VRRIRSILVLCVLFCSPVLADELQSVIANLELGRAYDEAVFVRAAESENPATRRVAARAAGRLKDEGALRWLGKLLDDRAGPVRRAAFFAMGQIGGDATFVLLRARLGSATQNDLPYVLEALGKTGDPRGVATAVRYLGHASPQVRGAAALALARLRDPSALPELFAALGSESEPEVRWRKMYAIWALVRTRVRKTKTPVAADASPIREMLQSVAPERPFAERVFAAQALGGVGDKAKRTVRALLDDPDPRVVVAALRGLGMDWDRDTASRVAGMIGHEDATVREAALRYLTAGGTRAGALRSVLDSPAVAASPALNLLARRALAEIGDNVHVSAPEGTPAEREELVWEINSYFPKHLPTSLPETVRGLRTAAGVCGEERVPTDIALRTLPALLKHEDFTVRAVAITSIGKRGAVTLVPAILEAAKRSRGTGDMDVRIEAANALAELKAYDPWLREAATGDPDRPVREAAPAALVKLDRALPPALPAAGFLLHGHDAAGVLEAARALRGARVVLETSRGIMTMVLYADEAPAHCVNFATLVRKGFYDGKRWHRVVADFVIQGGCPRGDGWGGPGYMVPDEIGTRPFVRGTVGMPKAGDDTGGCQIFITHLPTPHLDGRYTVYAQVVSGLEVIDRIRVGDKIVKATLTLPDAK